MQPQPPPELGFSDAEAGELNTESCFSTAELSHFGQLTFSRVERTMYSKLWWQRLQLYSKIGISPHFVWNCKEKIHSIICENTPKRSWLYAFFVSIVRGGDCRAGWLLGRLLPAHNRAAPPSVCGCWSRAASCVLPDHAISAPQSRIL